MNSRQTHSRRHRDGRATTGCVCRSSGTATTFYRVIRSVRSVPTVALLVGAQSHSRVFSSGGNWFQWIYFEAFARRVPSRDSQRSRSRKVQTDSETRVTTRATLGLTQAQSVIGRVGQLTSRKGQLELIESFARVPMNS